MLAAPAARDGSPIASITKLMTVLVALDHHQLADVVTVDPRAAAVGQEHRACAAGEQLTVARARRGGADPVGERRRRRARALGRARLRRVRDADEREGRARSASTDSHFVRPDGLDAPGEYSSARDVTRLALGAMRHPVRARHGRRQSTATIAGGRALHTWNDLLGVVPGVIGVKTGHTDDAGWSQVAAVRGDGGDALRDDPRQPVARRSATPTSQTLLAWGLAQYRRVDAIVARAAPTRGRSCRTAARRSRSSPREPLRPVVRVGRAAPASASSPRRRSRCRSRRGQVLGRVEVWSGGRLLGSRPLVASELGRPARVSRAA